MNGIPSLVGLGQEFSVFGEISFLKILLKVTAKKKTFAALYNIYRLSKSRAPFRVRGFFFPNL